MLTGKTIQPVFDVCLSAQFAAGNVSHLNKRQAATCPPGLEELEPRVLLSHASLVTPDFRLFTRPGATRPADTASPVGLSPSRLRHAYGFDAVRFAGVVGDGAGQTIAIVDAYDAPTLAADLHAFDVRFGLADPPSLTKLNQTGGTTPPGTDPAGKGDSWAVETSLDVEWAHAAAPGAKILVVEAKSASDSDLMAAIDTARKYAGVCVVSMSWGDSESATESSMNVHFTTPSGHKGVTFVASSGDSGAYDYNSFTRGVDDPAVSPNVVAVGGTRLNLDASGNYFSESGWGDGTLSGVDGGSGGGVSAYINQPAWQRGIVTQSSAFRTAPDVAFDADPASGVAVYDSWDYGSAAPWVTVGGTSLAAPLWAGLMAVVDQGRVLNGLTSLDGPSQTLPTIYSLPSSDFHDITTGNNGYAAGPGYDLVTGRGTPIVNLLVPAMAGMPVTPTPTIAAFAASPANLVAGGSLTLIATGVTESGGTIQAVKFYRESNGTAGLQAASDALMGTGTQSGSTWTISASTAGLAVGTYAYYALATDAAGLSSGAVAVTVTLTSPPPANDNFAGGTVISGTGASLAGTNVNATRESGEPNIAGDAGGKSVWYTWTARASGTVSVSTAGSSFDTLLGVYTGGSVSTTTLVAANDDASYSTLTSAVTFKAVAGTTYHIAVDGYGGASGSIALSLAEVTPPANDNFAAAASILGSTATWTGTNVGATREAGEPAVAGTTGGHSVWLTWTAPASGTVSINTHGSSFDTTLGVYTGSSVSTTTVVAQNDDDPAGGTLTSAVTFTATAGTTYYIAVDGYNAATGTVVVNLAM